MAKSVTVQYRSLNTAHDMPRADLKAMLVDVLRRRNEDQEISRNARLRIIDLDQDGSYVILNRVSDPATWNGPFFFGQLIHLQRGTDIEAVLQSLEEDTPEFILQTVNLGEDAQVLKGALYFAVNGNHVGLIEGLSVKGKVLERYLTALFQQAGELEPGQQVKLDASFAAQNGKEMTDFDEMTVSARPNRGFQAGGQELVDRQAGQARDEGHTVFDVLRLLGWEDEALTRLREEIPAEGRIEGLFKVFIKGRRRQKVRIPRTAVNEALRNMDPDEFNIRGDGSEKNGLVKLSCSKSVATIGAAGSLLDAEDAMVKILEALREWAQQGRIDCRFDA